MKQVFAWLLAIVTWASIPALGEEGVPYARDLQKDAAAARAKNGVVLVMFSGAHCRYCEIVLNEFLIPMTRNADYQSRVVMRKVESSGYSNMLDFQGRTVSQRQFAGEHGVRMTPTVMVFDAQGNALGKPLIGLTTVDYYGGYLDQAIDQGVAKVRGLLGAKVSP